MIKVLWAYILFFPIFLTNGQNVAISLEKFRVLYVDFENIINVSVSNYSCESIYIKSKHSKIQRVDSCRFIINPTRTMTETLFVYSVKNSDTTLIDTLNFLTKLFPMPTAMIEKPPKDRQFIPVPNKLNASIVNFDFDVKYQVISYCIKYYKNAVLVDSIPVDGNIIDSRLNNIYMKLKPGEKCWIDNIRVQRENGKIEEINSIYLKCPE